MNETCLSQAVVSVKAEADGQVMWGKNLMSIRTNAAEDAKPHREMAYNYWPK